MGPLNKVMEMLPGMGNILKDQGAGRDSSQKIKGYMTIMDSMTDKGAHLLLQQQTTTRKTTNNNKQ